MASKTNNFSILSSIYASSPLILQNSTFQNLGILRHGSDRDPAHSLKELSVRYLCLGHCKSQLGKPLGLWDIWIIIEKMTNKLTNKMTNKQPLLCRQVCGSLLSTANGTDTAESNNMCRSVTTDNECPHETANWSLNVTSRENRYHQT